MIVQVDVGNTYAKWRCLLDGAALNSGWCVVESLVSDIEDALMRCDVSFSSLIVHLASVRSESDIQALREGLLALHDDAQLLHARSEKSWKNVTFAYEHPSSQGVDRCLGMLAAYDIFESVLGYEGVMVLDAGSALTVDVVDASGVQVEGYILPGYSMMRSSLLGSTASVGGAYALGRACNSLSTESCVEDGVAMAFYSVLRAFVAIAKESGYLVVITGGDARRCKSVLAEGVLFKPDLVLDGMTSLFANAIGGVN